MPTCDEIVVESWFSLSVCTRTHVIDVADVQDELPPVNGKTKSFQSPPAEKTDGYVQVRSANSHGVGASAVLGVRLATPKFTPSIVMIFPPETGKFGVCATVIAAEL